jgi:hypothetical protein
MDMKRRAARGIAVLAIALAAGHLVQNMGRDRAPKQVASAEVANKPTKIEPVAAGPEAVKPAVLVPEANAPKAPEKPLVEVQKPAVVAEPAPAPKPAPEPAKVAEPVAPVEPAAKPEVVQAATEPEAPACDLSLELVNMPSAMIGVTLLAPCHPNQRVVLRHAGLAVTGQTTATGALFTDLPALETAASVEAFFADGTRAKAEVAMPELATLRRFGVQWQADDAFQLNAFEDGATYGDPGHVSATDPHGPVAGLPPKGGFLTLVGDATAANPLLAQVYTYPADPAAKPEVFVEAAVTDKTCGRELIGETLTSTGGSTFVTDLTLAMPECDAIGDYLVLKNLVLDRNMAAVN